MENPHLINYLPLPYSFKVSFIGMLFLLIVAVYELLQPNERGVWLAIAFSTVAGAYLKPPVATVLGLLLAAIMTAYFIVAAAFNPATGSGWLTLLIVPWLPILASNAAEYARKIQAQLDAARAMLEASENLHPVTSLPGKGIAKEMIHAICAHIHRQHHEALLIDIKITNFELLKSVSEEDAASYVQLAIRDTVRQSVRTSDCMFQLVDEHILVLCDIGGRMQGYAFDEVRDLYEDLRKNIEGIKMKSVKRPKSMNTSSKEVVLSKLIENLSRISIADLEIRSLSVPKSLPELDKILVEMNLETPRKCIPSVKANL